MKIADTISVNPSKTTLGHVEATSSIFRNPVLGVENPAHSINFVNMVFPASKSGLTEYRKYEVPLRAMFATILIVTGISLLSTTFAAHSAGFAICTLVFGGFLALGLLTRPVMLGAAIFYCINGALAIRSGSPDVSVFSMMFGCLIFAVIGGGKYSLDTLIRGSIRRYSKHAERKRRENLMSYKAFHNVKF